jgi:hypothetical protein
MVYPDLATDTFNVPFAVKPEMDRMYGLRPLIFNMDTLDRPPVPLNVISEARSWLNGAENCKVNAVVIVGGTPGAPSAVKLAKSMVRIIFTVCGWSITPDFMTLTVKVSLMLTPEMDRLYVLMIVPAVTEFLTMLVLLKIMSLTTSPLGIAALKAKVNELVVPFVELAVTLVKDTDPLLPNVTSLLIDLGVIVYPTLSTTVTVTCPLVATPEMARVYVGPFPVSAPLIAPVEPPLKSISSPGIAWLNSRINAVVVPVAGVAVKLTKLTVVADPPL